MEPGRKKKMFQPFKSFNRYAQLNLFPRRVAGEDEGAERLELIEHGKTYGTF